MPFLLFPQVVPKVLFDFEGGNELHGIREGMLVTGRRAGAKKAVPLRQTNSQQGILRF